MTTYWNEYTEIHKAFGQTEYYTVYEFSGERKAMRGHDEAVATFGQFERVVTLGKDPRPIIRWSMYLGTDKDLREYGRQEWYQDQCHGEFSDDLVALREGRVEFIG